jgi:hypothetical protein
MVDLLDLADRAGAVAELAQVLDALLAKGELPDVDALRDRFTPRQLGDAGSGGGAARDLGVRRVAGGSMSGAASTANTVDVSGAGAAVPIMLTELRLPTMKRLWADLAAQSNWEGWPAERLPHTLLGHEIGRARDSSPGQGAGRQRLATGQEPGGVRLRRRCQRCPRPM